MKKIHWSFPVFLLFGLTSLFTALIPSTFSSRQEIAAAMQKTIQTELLNVWYPRAVDQTYGGFVSTFERDWQRGKSQDKMIVTQARHTWTNAKASQMYPDSVQYLKNAAHGYRFLRDKMWDQQYGGFYTLVDQQGNVKTTAGEQKTAYGNSFAIYGLAAYYQASGDTSALNLAKRTFMWLEEHSHDPKYKGYFQSLANDGTPIPRTSDMPSSSTIGYKDQNSSIHLLEAFTELYSVWPDPLVAERLKEMLYLIRDKIVTDKGYLTLYLQPDLTPLSFRDSSSAVIKQHHYLDHVSFGHDVETAYLMLEASHVLGIQHDEKTEKIAKKMVDHALRNGWDEKTGGFYDGGYYFKDNANITIVEDGKNWWSQAEGLNTLLMMADKYPTDTMNYYARFEKLWQYTDKYLIDHQYGGWYAGGLDKQPEMQQAQKGQIWKANYHNFRALFSCLRRLEPDTKAPSIPANIKLDKNTLYWEAAKDNQTLLGYYIYQGDDRIGFTPLNSFVLETNIQGFGDFMIQSLDLSGNLSKKSKAARKD